MAELINIASFDFDTDKLFTKLVELKKGISDFSTSISDNKKAIKESEKVLSNTAKLMEDLEKAGQGTSEAYKQLQEIQDAETESIKKNYEAMSASELALKSLRSEYNSTSKVIQANSDAQITAKSATEEATEAMEREINSINIARASNTELLAIRNNLNPAIAEEAELIQQLNEKLDSNNEYIKANVSAYEQQKIGIGDYKNQIVEAYQELNIFNGGLVGFAQRAQQAGGAGNLLSTSFKAMTTGLYGMAKASLAFIATGIGAVIAALGLIVLGLINYFKSTVDGVEKLSAVMEPLKAIFESLIGVVQTVIGTLLDFGKVRKILEDTYNYIKDKFIKVWEGLYDVVVGFATMDFEQMKQGLEGIADTYKEVYSDAIEAGKAVGEFFQEAIDKGAEIDRLNKEIKRDENDLIIARAESTKKLREQEKIIKDQSKSQKEINDALIESDRIIAEIAKKETDILDKKIRQKEIQHSLNDTSLDDQAEMNELIAERMAKEEEADQRQIKLLRAQNKLRADAASKAKQARDNANAQAEKNFQASLKRQQEELDFFIANQGFRKKSLEEEYKLQVQIDKDLRSMLDLQLKNGKISKTKYNTEILALDNELARMQAEILAKNAEDELNEFLRANEGILESNNLLNEELVEQERKRIQIERGLREDAERVRFEQGLQTEQEYQDALIDIFQEAKQRELDLTSQYNDQLRAQEVTERALAREAEILEMQLAGENKIEIEKQIRDNAFQAELEQLNEQRELELMSEEEYQQRVNNLLLKYRLEDKESAERIEELKKNSKIQIASQAFGMMGEIFGKESAMGKAAAIAQTTIDTYQAATAAFKAMAGIPVVGPALGTAAAGMAVISGLLNVKKIVSVKQPKVERLPGFARGGQVLGGTPISRRNGDDVMITARRGEMILTEEQQRLAGGNDFFKSLGVPNLRSSSSASATGIAQKVMDAEMIYQAVRDGSYVGASGGSQDGIRGLAIDQEIERNSML